MEEPKLKLKKPKKLKRDKESKDKEIKRIPRINFIHDILLEVVRTHVDDFREIFESLKNFIDTPEELKYLEEDLKFFDEEIDKFKVLVFTAIRDSTSKFDTFIIAFLKNIHRIDLQREHYIKKDGGQAGIDKEGWDRLIYIFDMFNQNLFSSLDSIANNIKMTVLEGINNGSENFIEPLNNLIEKINSLESLDLDSWKTQTKLNSILFEDSTLLVSINQAISTSDVESIIMLFIEGLERQLERKTGDRLSEFQGFALDLRKVVNNMSEVLKKISNAKSEEERMKYDVLWSEYFLFSKNIYTNNEIPHYLTDIQLTLKEIDCMRKDRNTWKEKSKK